MPNNRRFVGFAAFTAVFAVLAAIVFWGAWSPNIAIYAPDDAIRFALSSGDNWTSWLNWVVTTGKILPTDLVFRGLLGSPLFAHELKYALSAYLSALALAWFLRGRGLSPLAAYGAALFLGFSGYWLTLFSAGHAGWFVWMSYGVFAFGLIDRAVSTAQWRYWLLLGVVVAWAGFEQPDLWYLFSLLTAAYLVFRLVEARRFPWTRILASAGVFVVVSLPNFLSFSDVLAGREAQISGNSEAAASQEDRWTFVTNWSLPPSEAAEFVVPRLNGDTSCPVALSVNSKDGLRLYRGALGRPKDAADGNYRQHSLYLGLVTLIFAVVGIFSGKRREVWFFAIAAVVCFLLSLGRHCEWVYRCFYVLPLGDSIRCPVKWHHLTEFCVAVLAAYGIERILSVAKGRVSFISAVAAIILLQAGYLAVEAHRYSVPIDYSQAIASRCSARLTVLGVPPEYASNSRVARAIARENGFEDMVFVAPYFAAPHASVVQILTPLKPVSPKPVKALPSVLALLSFSAALAVLVYSVKQSRRIN